MKKKINKTILIIAVLAVLLLCALGYILFGAYSEARTAEQLEIYENGYYSGYETAVSDLFEASADCQTIPVTHGNETMSLIDVSCLSVSE